MTEQAITGWKAIAAMFDKSERSMQRLGPELKACGAIWFTLKGRPPRRVVCAWPSVLQRWTMLKQTKGERI